MFPRDTKSSESTESPSISSNSAPSSTPSSASDKPTAALPSIISPGFKITGNLKSSGDVQIDGIIEGDINCRLLTIGQTGEMLGSITAETVRVSGKVEGQIKAKSVTFHRTAEMIGEIMHGSLTIESGAQIEGPVSRMQKASNGNGGEIASFDRTTSVKDGAATIL